jgi:phosphoenolpyruvate synthase/pyruvate phosphate dikinase
VENRRKGGSDDGFPGCPWFERAFVEPSPRTLSGEQPTIGGFGEADVAMAMLQLNLVRQIAEAEQFERAVALASDADVTVVLSGTTEEVFNERDEAVWRMSASLIEEAHRASRKVAICGQAPSDCPEFAAFLVEQEIDSISLSPGAVVPTTPEILEVEQKTDRPRGRV